MASEFCLLIFCLLVEITSCIHGLCAGNPSDLNEWLPCSSQTACIRQVIAHVHPPGDVNRSIIRGLPKLRALLLTSCVQGADIMMIADIMMTTIITQYAQILLLSHMTKAQRLQLILVKLETNGTFKHQQAEWERQARSGRNQSLVHDVCKKTSACSTLALRQRC